MGTVEEKKALGNEAYKNKDYSTAITLYQEAIEIAEESDETISVLYANLAAAQLSLKNYDEAVIAAQKCLNKDPSAVKAHLRLATALTELKRYEEASKAISAGLRMAKALTGTDVNKKKNKTVGLNEFKKLQQRIQRESAPTGSINPGQPRAQLNEQELKAIEELQGGLHELLINGKKAVKEKERANVDKRRMELTLQQLDALEDNATTYLSMGRMFLRKDLSSIRKDLVEEKKGYEETHEKMTKMEAFYDGKIRNTESNIREIVQGS